VNIEFLVVFEDVWNQKHSIQTNHIADAIKQHRDTFGFELDADLDETENKDFLAIGPFDLVYYDIECYEQDGEYAGRIYIFEVEVYHDSPRK
jgi:hypothetical protein